jgi:protocatechuate 3,4-dioxygenase beta subunit
MNQQNKRCTDKLFTRKKASFRVATMLSLCLLLLWGSTCFAQGTTSVLSGIVFDPQGRVVSNATVTLISDDKGTQWTAKTNEAGSWRVNALVAGRYHFSVSAPGFARVEHSSFFLEMGTQRNLDSTLQLGASTERAVD